MKRPWMPIYWNDFIADTQHLSAEETGAYLLLIGHYWLRGHLPNDDVKLARIARLPLPAWLEMKGTLQDFFHNGWKHKRVEFELTEVQRLSNAGRTGGLASAEARRRTKKKKSTTYGPSGEGSGNDQATIVQRSGNDRSTDDQQTGNDHATISQALHSHLSKKKESSTTRGEPTPTIEKTEEWQIANEIADLCGEYERQQFALGSWGGAVTVVQLWRTQWSRDLILNSVKHQLAKRKVKARIQTIRFFENGIGEYAARLRALRENPPQPTVYSNGQATKHPPSGWQQHRDDARDARAEFKQHVKTDVLREGSG